MKWSMKEWIFLAAQYSAVKASRIRRSKNHHPFGCQKFLNAKHPIPWVNYMLDNLIQKNKIEFLFDLEILEHPYKRLDARAPGAFRCNNSVRFNAMTFKAAGILLK